MKKRKLLLLVLFACSIAATNLYAQSVTKTFAADPLTEVLKEVETQTGLSIIYKSDDVDGKKTITATYNATPVKKVLSEVLDSQLEFTLENKMIVIYKKGTKPMSIQPTKSNKKIGGTVLDDKGEPLIGATIRIKDTTVGALTDVNGKFSIDKVPGAATHIFITSIGYQPQEVKIGNQTNFDIVMYQDTKMLEEVVVTAMGIERKAKSLTYATQKMDSEELMRVQDANFINSLQGKAAGLSITPNAGGAGGSSKILLRGNKSVLGNNTPLVVVDGIPMSNPVRGQQGVEGGQAIGYNFSTEGSDALSSINPDDIESVNILKGANAAALYGSAASNGVLMITTKKGKEGHLSIKLSSNATFEQPLLLPKIQNTYGAAVNTFSNSVASESWGKKMIDMTDAELGVKHLTNTPQNYIEDFFKTGSTFNNSISLSGGSKLIKSYFSYGNTRSAGMIENNKFNRHTISFRQSYNLFNDKITIDASINYLNQSTKNRPGGGTSLNPLFNLYTAPRNVDMGYYKNNYSIAEGKWKSNPYSYYKNINGKFNWVTTRVDLTGNQQDWVYTSADQNNPYWLINMINRYDDQERVYGYLSGSLRITKDLTAQARFSIDRSKSTGRTETAATTQFPSTMLDFGEFRQSISNTNEFYFDWMVNYNKEITDFSFSAATGYTAHKIMGTYQSIIATATAEDARRNILPSQVNLFDPRAGLTGGRGYNRSINWDEGIFFTGQVGYKDFLFLEGSYRRDWYRAFRQFSVARGTPDNYGYFSLGVNSLIHEVVKLPDFWNYLKLRTSYSEVGNSIPNVMFATVGVDLVTGAAIPSSYSYFDNPIPEKTKSFEAGFDASFFKNALEWDMTFYYTTLNNAYLIVGRAGKKKPVNSGVIRNMGIETTLSYSLAFAKDFIWKTGVNFAYNNNKILDTYKDKDGAESKIEQLIGFGGKAQIKYTEGGSYGDLYVTDFEREADGTIMLNDNGTPSLSSNKFGVFMGNMNAPYQLGWNNSLSYKNFNLYFLIDGRIGGKVISFTEAYLDFEGLSQRTESARLAYEADKQNLTFHYTNTAGDKLESPGMRLEDGRITSIEAYYKGIGGDINATQYVYDATNFRLREVSVGYTFQNLLGQSKHLSLSLVGRNLFFLFNKAPIDPDTSISTQNGLGSIDVFNMPSSRSLGVALSVTL